MSIDSVKRQIEGYKRDIDREKSRIADYKDEMAKTEFEKVEIPIIIHAD